MTCWQYLAIAVTTHHATCAMLGTPTTSKLGYFVASPVAWAAVEALRAIVTGGRHRE